MTCVVGPEYVCAVLEDRENRLLLQLRAPYSRIAGGLMTCFGGRVEGGETAEAALTRELDEEIGWHPTTVTPCCELWKVGRFIARFYRAQLDVAATMLRIEAGSAAILAPWPALPGLPLSPWHRPVLDAVRLGLDRAEVPAV